MAKKAKARKQPEIHKGLVGVVADTTAISRVVPEKRMLTYRGYAVHELAEKCSFEEVAYLLLIGELPSKAQLAGFKRKERAARELSRTHLAVVKQFPKAANALTKRLKEVVGDLRDVGISVDIGKSGKRWVVIRRSPDKTVQADQPSAGPVN